MKDRNSDKVKNIFGTTWFQKIALEPSQPMGKFLQYGQMTYRNAVQYIDDVKEAQKKIRQLAESNGVDVPYETKEWNPNMMGFGI